MHTRSSCARSAYGGFPSACKTLLSVCRNYAIRFIAPPFFLVMTPACLHPHFSSRLYFVESLRQQDVARENCSRPPPSTPVLPPSSNRHDA